MHRLLALLFIFVPLSAFAAKWSPYLGCALQYDLLIPVFGITSATSSGYLHEFGSWGSQWELGASTPDISVYGAYHFSASPGYGEHYTNACSSWKEKRMLLGARWQMDGAGSFPVKPVIGAALSYGRSRLGWIVPGRDESRYSRYNLGTMLEFGLLVQELSPVEFTVLAQFHRFESDFGNDHNNHTQDYYVVMVPSIQLGLRYVFSSLSIGK